MNKRKSFLIHIDSLDILDDLTNEQCGELFKAIKSYQQNEEITLSAIAKVAFSPFKNQFKRDFEKYKITCERRALAGSMGGKQKVANASKCKQDLANVADNKNKNKTKNKNDNNNKKEKTIRKVFTKPTRHDIDCYASAKNLNLTNFFDYYESNGWKVGKNPMKNWQAAASGWSKRQGQYSSNQPDFSDTSTDWVNKDYGLL